MHLLCCDSLETLVHGHSMFFCCGSSKLFCVFCILRTPLISFLELQNVQFPLRSLSSDHHCFNDHFSDGHQRQIITQSSTTCSSKNTHWQKMFWKKKTRLFFISQPQCNYVRQRSLHLLQQGTAVCPRERPGVTSVSHISQKMTQCLRKQKAKRSRRVQKPDTLN